ncbi:hypothetical protein [Pseudochryseolinea flava]|uniref:Uncharacterized protein n=1 Tax=Pseudochryseolinea flava TaxID=2059302 RepID=A0A364Y0I3_9BACT|nr:hypothetical protein [Pseudochryseolinea flava]RAW00165.1 hypothetical protein DQQ10_16585 [Pseudochryseolinea flava]
MKDLDNTYDDRIFSLLDGTLSPEQAKRLMTEIELSASLKAQYEEAKLIHSMLAGPALSDPPSNFTHVVMNKVNGSASLAQPSIWKGIFLLCGVLLTMAIAIVLVSQGVFNETTTLDLDHLNVPQGILPEISINGKLIMNVILALNLIIGFIVLDRTILKPLFTKRRVSA